MIDRKTELLLDIQSTKAHYYESYKWCMKKADEVEESKRKLTAAEHEMSIRESEYRDAIRGYRRFFRGGSGMKCNKCQHEFSKYEHYVSIGACQLCETCFFDLAVIELGAKERQMGRTEEE